MAEPAGGAAGQDGASRQALPLAERVLDVAAGLAGSGAEVQVVVRTGTSALTRFAGSAVHQNVTEEVLDVRLSVTVGGRTADGRLTGSGDDALRRLAAATLAAARLRPVDPDWPGLAPVADVPAVARADTATASAAPADRAALVAAFVDAAGGLECAGFCATSGIVTGYASSAGQRASALVTSAVVDGIARVPTGGTTTADGGGRHASVRLADLDAAAAGARAAATARAAAQDPLDLAPGRYPVLLEPKAVADVLDYLALYGLASRPVHERQSYAALGVAQMDPAVSLVADPLDRRLPGLPFDGEGTPRRRFDLVRDGVTVGLARDRRDARRDGGGDGGAPDRRRGVRADVQSTGSATDHRWVSGGIATHLVLEPGTAARDELLAALGRGLLVTDLWYTRVLDPRTLVTTGLTRNGVFLVEDGRVTRPVANLRFTQSYPGALAPGNVLGVGADATVLVDELFARVTPSLALASWNVTGGARG